MDMRGRWGEVVNCSMRSDSGMRVGVTPGKWVWKNCGRREGLEARVEKCEEGAKRVHVKEWSGEGIAMNMKEPAGQMWRW